MSGTRAAGGYEAVIGLEVHAQLLTRTKLFCRCPNAYGGEPNTRVCPVCLGLPGALPSLNGEAVRLAVRLGSALGSRIERTSIFARKNYFYPDCPKNYQISMYDRPLCTGGAIEPGPGVKGGKIVIERIHLEEDAGKLIHDGTTSLVDFNRSGVPLVEIVTGPVIDSPRRAASCLRDLRQALRYLGVCDGNLEEGSMRCDVNVSVRPPGSAELGTRTEIKNLNSFKAVATALETEIERQTALLEGGGLVRRSTWLWDEGSGRLAMMRHKEEAMDYRYFPEPDLPPLVVDEGMIEEELLRIPESPRARAERFAASWDISPEDAAVLVSESGLADYFEETASISGLPGPSARLVLREVLREVKRTAGGLVALRVRPPDLAVLAGMIEAGRIHASAASEVFEEMAATGEDAETVTARLGLELLDARDEIRSLVGEVLAENPSEVERYRSGKKQLLRWFTGQVMKRSGGRADPRVVGEILLSRLEE